MRAHSSGTSAEFGGVDGLVMNVGIGAGLGIAGTSVEDWDRVMAVNARSHFLGCKLGLASMAEGGSIVLVGSVASREVMPFPVYAASKSALEALCRQSAVEGAPRIRTNLLTPGLIDTSLGRLASQVSPLRDQVFIPARRQGTAWEVAYGALYLISGESSYVTGQSLIVDGGLTVGPRARARERAARPAAAARPLGGRSEAHPGGDARGYRSQARRQQHLPDLRPAPRPLPGLAALRRLPAYRREAPRSRPRAAHPAHRGQLPVLVRVGTARPHLARRRNGTGDRRPRAGGPRHRGVEPARGRAAAGRGRAPPTTRGSAMAPGRPLPRPTTRSS